MMMMYMMLVACCGLLCCCCCSYALVPFSAILHAYRLPLITSGIIVVVDCSVLNLVRRTCTTTRIIVCMYCVLNVRRYV